MTEELTSSLRVIHQLERSTRILELVRDEVRQKIALEIARCERQGQSPESTPAVTRALALITVCDRAIRGAETQIAKLEKGDLVDPH